MIEVTLYNYLKTALSPIHVTFEKQKNMPDSYVLLEKTGSSQNDLLMNSTFAIQSYASTMYESMVLNQKVKEMMEDAVNLSIITKVELNSDYNFTDTATKKPRYQAVFDITHYKE